MSEDARLVIRIDYEPDLSDYPADVTTKLEAMEHDMNALHDGIISEEDVLSWADSIDVEVESR